MCNQRSAGIILSLLAASCIFLLTACGGGHSDKEIQDRISVYLAENPEYKVSPTVKDGVVSLAGTCEGNDCAASIENKIKAIDGVKRVANKIVGEEKTDLTLRTSVQAIISKYEGVQADVAAGEIVLRGNIDRAQIQPLMNELEALHPQKIDNQLAITK